MGRGGVVYCDLARNRRGADVVEEFKTTVSTSGLAALVGGVWWGIFDVVCGLRLERVSTRDGGNIPDSHPDAASGNIYRHSAGEEWEEARALIIQTFVLAMISSLILGNEIVQRAVLCGLRLFSLGWLYLMSLWGDILA